MVENATESIYFKSHMWSPNIECWRTVFRKLVYLRLLGKERNPLLSVHSPLGQLQQRTVCMQSVFLRAMRAFTSVRARLLFVYSFLKASAERDSFFLVSAAG